MTSAPPSVFVLATSIFLTACTSSVDAPPNEWAVKAQQDLKVAHAKMLESHPGPLDKENPDFTTQANASLDNALALARNVTDQSGYGAVLRAYTAGFRDGHFVVFSNAQYSDEIDYFWPGMLPAWRADTVKITYAEADESDLLGAEVLSCDGVPISDLIRDHIFQFDSGKPEQESYWARRAHNLFIYSGNPFITQLESCTFRLSSGETVTRALNWRLAPNKVFTTLRWETIFGLRPEIGMAEIRPGEFWINLPDFSPDDEGTRKNRAMFAEIIRRRTELRNAKSIVIDMRGNQGGSSAWGIEMIDALWGEAYRESREVDHDISIDWRLSEANIAHMGVIVDYVIEKGYDENIIESFRKTYEGSQEAHAEGRDFYTEEDDVDDETASSKRVNQANPVKAPVYLLTHGTCVSACLDFADALFEFEGITHIGYPTGSDTVYMEIRQEELPSGLATIAIPTKVWRNRPRGSGEYYEPVHRYDGFDWSDEAIQAWVRSITQ